MPEPGLCGKCGKASDCLNTSHGWMCRPCFHAALKVDQKEGPRLYTLPEPGKKVWVVMEPPGIFITVGGILYAFDRKQEADEIAQGLRQAYGISMAYVLQIDAIEALNYVLRQPSLKLVGVKERVPGKRAAGPDEIDVPVL